MSKGRLQGEGGESNFKMQVLFNEGRKLLGIKSGAKHVDEGSLPKGGSLERFLVQVPVPVMVVVDGMSRSAGCSLQSRGSQGFDPMTRRPPTCVTAHRIQAFMHSCMRIEGLSSGEKDQFFCCHLHSFIH